YLGGVTKDPRLNILNAPTLSKQKGINLSSNRAPATSGPDLKLTLKLSSGVATIVGSLEGEAVVLRSIGDSDFIGGLQLAGDQLFFQAQPGKGGFAGVEAVLTQGGISATAVQRSTTGELTWFVARVTGVTSVSNIPAGDLSAPQLLTF
ncbi:unnamed protein product, partial [Allacma fusca]